jgi:hypothetical protein
MRKTVLLISLLLPLLTCKALNAETGKLYSVIFGVTIDKSGKLANLNVNSVMDQSTGSNVSVKMDIAKVYIGKVRQYIARKGYKPNVENGKPKEFYTYFFYDPSNPSRIDLEPHEK